MVTRTHPEKSWNVPGGREGVFSHPGADIRKPHTTPGNPWVRKHPSPPPPQKLRPRFVSAHTPPTGCPAARNGSDRRLQFHRHPNKRTVAIFCRPSRRGSPGTDARIVFFLSAAGGEKPGYYVTHTRFSSPLLTVIRESETPGSRMEQTEGDGGCNGGGRPGPRS